MYIIPVDGSWMLNNGCDSADCQDNLRSGLLLAARCDSFFLTFQPWLLLVALSSPPPHRLHFLRLYHAHCPSATCGSDSSPIAPPPISDPTATLWAPSTSRSWSPPPLSHLTTLNPNLESSPPTLIHQLVRPPLHQLDPSPPAGLLLIIRFAPINPRSRDGSSATLPVDKHLWIHGC
jgi:hypothetical protein